MITETYRFTVFTPTFNRADTLVRVYESLRCQSFRDFEWLILDDGSTDNTREMVTKWQGEATFPIRYFWQENAHKKTAFNRGVREARGELFLCVDSDDALLLDALATFDRYWREIADTERLKFAGISGLCADVDGKVIGEEFPETRLDSNYIELFYKHRVRGDKCAFHRTEVLRQFPFPKDIKGHVPEGIVWWSVAHSYDVRCINEVVLRVYFDSTNSLTRATSGASLARNAEGHAFWAARTLSEDIGWFWSMPLRFVRMAANYTRFCKHMWLMGNFKSYPVAGFWGRSLVAIMYPVGWFLFRRDLAR